MPGLDLVPRRPPRLPTSPKAPQALHRGFQVQALGYGLEGSGFRVRALGFGLEGFGLWGFEFRVRAVRFRVYHASGFGFIRA